MPLLTETRVLSPFGMRIHPVTKEETMHTGVDLFAHFVPLYAYDEGVVKRTGETATMGKYICIEHSPKLTSWYLHLSDWYVKQGEAVLRKGLIGRTGDSGRVTGPHLHFELRYRGEAVDPMLFSPITELKVTLEGVPYKAVFNHKDERMYVEIREFAKALGAKVNWSPAKTEVDPVLLKELERLLREYRPL